MHFEFDYPSHLKWLGHHWHDDIRDIGGLAVPALKMLQSVAPFGRGLDIGCGTGHFALQLARHTKLHILGIDIYEPFISRARIQSQSEALSCEFQCDDARSILRRTDFNSAFNVVIALASGDIFDSPVAAASRLNAVVCEHGYLLIGWISEKDMAKHELAELKWHVQDNLHSHVVDVFTEDSVFDFDSEVLRSNKIVAFDASRVSENDADVLREWAQLRLEQMRPSAGRVSMKAVVLAKTLAVQEDS